jgi:hypothetical protein
MNEFEPWSERPKAESVRIFGVEVRQGDRVRLWPQKRSDILDSAMAGKLAMVEAIEEDYDGQLHLAVVLDDDPGRELGLMRQPGHRFFFSPEEVEPVALANPSMEAENPARGKP